MSKTDDRYSQKGVGYLRLPRTESALSHAYDQCFEDGGGGLEKAFTTTLVPSQGVLMGAYTGFGTVTSS